MCDLINTVSKCIDQVCHCLPDSDRKLGLRLSGWQLLVKMTVLRLFPALAPHTDLLPVIVRTWKVLGSLWMVSVNAADRGITSSHNFGSQWQMLPARQWRSSYHLSLFLWLPQTWTPISLSSDHQTLRGVWWSHSNCQPSFVKWFRRHIILVIYSNNHLMRISFNISLAFVFF